MGVLQQSLQDQCGDGSASWEDGLSPAVPSRERSLTRHGSDGLSAKTESQEASLAGYGKEKLFLVPRSSRGATAKTPGTPSATKR